MDLAHEIEILLKRYLDSLNDRRWEEFASCLDDDLGYFTDRCVIQNKEEFIRFF